MKLRYFDDKKEKCFSHELKIIFEYSEVTTMAESKEECIENMKEIVKDLICKLKEINYSEIK